MALDPSTSSTHYAKIRYLTNLQEELLREEARVRESLIEIQSKIISHMDVMQKHIAHEKILAHDNKFSIAKHMMEISREVQIDIHILEVL